MLIITSPFPNMCLHRTDIHPRIVQVASNTSILNDIRARTTELTRNLCKSTHIWAFIGREPRTQMHSYLESAGLPGARGSGPGESVDTISGGRDRSRPLDAEDIMACLHSYTFSAYCGVEVCDKCGDHKGLARCYCGWNLAAGERLEDDTGDAVFDGETWTDDS